MQVDSINELPEDKRPPELMLWDDSVDTINKWIKDVVTGKKEKTSTFVISEKDIEG